MYFLGIFAYLNYLTPKSRREILELLVNGLKRLEYRGYDSAGKINFPSNLIFLHFLWIFDRKFIEANYNSFDNLWLHIVINCWFIINKSNFAGVGLDSPNSHDISIIKKKGKVKALEDEIFKRKSLIMHKYNYLIILQLCNCKFSQMTTWTTTSSRSLMSE